MGELVSVVNSVNCSATIIGDIVSNSFVNVVGAACIDHCVGISVVDESLF